MLSINGGVALPYATIEGRQREGQRSIKRANASMLPILVVKCSTLHVCVALCIMKCNMKHCMYSLFTTCILCCYNYSARATFDSWQEHLSLLLA